MVSTEANRLDQKAPSGSLEENNQDQRAHGLQAGTAEKRIDDMKTQTRIEELETELSGAHHDSEVNQVLDMRAELAELKAAQHTPGPWYSNGPWLIQATSGIDGHRENGEAIPALPVTVAQVTPQRCDEGSGRRAANARLIAAAPELLEACRAFLPLATDAKCIQSVKWTTARDIAITAIAKAEGRQP